MHPPLYAIDLDGTVTAEEILPRLAKELGIEEEIRLLTRLTLDGTLDFEASFRLRFHILRSLDIPTAQRVVAQTPLDPHILAFIREHAGQCVILTGNLDRWIEPLMRTLGCAFRCSTSREEDGRLVLESVLDKGAAMRELAGTHRKTVAIGESVNDIPMFAEADCGVAYGGVHAPVPELLRLARHSAYDGESLCRLLRSL